MPWKTLDLDFTLRELSILDEHGEGRVDETLAPKLDHDTLRRLLRAMILSRRLDERMIRMQRQGDMGTFAPIRGQEALQIGSAYALRKDDWFVPSYRSAGSQLWRGWSIESILLLWSGFSQGFRPPDGVNDLPMCIVVGSHPIVAVGLGVAVNYRGLDQVVMTTYGDGATSQGPVNEAYNFAGVYNAPVIFLCENNHYAISTTFAQQTRAKTCAQRAIGFGFEGVRVDGNDLFAVMVACQIAVEKARSGGGPTLIEALTYRLEMHTTADDPKRYRDDDEVRRWESRDPIARFEKYLTQRGVIDRAGIDEMTADVDEELVAARKRYDALAVPDMSNLFDFVYADLPTELVEQKEEFYRLLHEAKERRG